MEEHEGTPIKESSSGSNLINMFETTVELQKNIIEGNKNLIKVLEGTIVSQSWKISELESKIRMRDLHINKLEKDLRRVMSRKSILNWFVKKFKA